mmetsp:Transcript_53602/g.173057  ORF Transcript_53602/g.173057 Transcript_53602/m.173057 type:complete len:192 (+) Transcript_53602:153-728(+)
MRNGIHWRRVSASTCRSRKKKACPTSSADSSSTKRKRVPSRLKEAASSNGLGSPAATGSISKASNASCVGSPPLSPGAKPSSQESNQAPPQRSSSAASGGQHTNAQAQAAVSASMVRNIKNSDIPAGPRGSTGTSSTSTRTRSSSGAVVNQVLVTDFVEAGFEKAQVTRALIKANNCPHRAASILVSGDAA